MAAARAGKRHCQVRLVVSPVVYETLKPVAAVTNRDVEAVKFLWKRKHIERDWKRKRTWKRLILSEAGSGSKKFQDKEAEANSEA